MHIYILTYIQHSGNYSKNIISFQIANPNWESQTPKTQRSQQGRQPSKERENFRKESLTIIKPDNNKKFNKSKMKF